MKRKTCISPRTFPTSHAVRAILHENQGLEPNGQQQKMTEPAPAIERRQIELHLSRLTLNSLCTIIGTKATRNS